MRCSGTQNKQPCTLMSAHILPAAKYNIDELLLKCEIRVLYLHVLTVLYSDVWVADTV